LVVLKTFWSVAEKTGQEQIWQAI